MTDTRIALVGNPNCGKTTVFNELTGSRQRTGNWPGVTVERKEGRFSRSGREVQVVDLPGTYALDSDAPSLDERIARDYLVSGQPDLVVDIVDAANLERGLYLTAQLAETGVPLLVVLNRIDAAQAHGYAIDAEALGQRLGCPVLTTVASRGEGIAGLRSAIVEHAGSVIGPAPQIPYHEAVEDAVASLGHLPGLDARTLSPRWLALELLQGQGGWDRSLGPEAAALAERQRLRVETQTGEAAELLIADGRYEYARQTAQVVLRRPGQLRPTRSDHIDRLALHPWLGVPLFLGVMYLLFLFSINLSDAFIELFDVAAGVVFVDGVGHALGWLDSPDWLQTLLADGVGGGIQVVATFIPVIGFLYLFLSLLEDSGYMARAAFLMDRFMRAIGLPGKAFAPLIVGFGCNVPAIMAARTLDSPRERILTIMMAPFMSCGARLSVYAVFAAAFFPTGGQNIVFALYLIGIAAAVLTAVIVRRSLADEPSQPFMMELPSYQIPTAKGIALRTWDRLRGFVLGAGKIIVAMVLVLNVLSALGTDGSFTSPQRQDSALGAIGRELTPIFQPMGIEEDNWPATVGIFTGLLAKEVVVGTLDSMYTGLTAAQASAPEVAPPPPGQRLISAVTALPGNLAEVARSLGDPLGLGVLGGERSATAAELEVSSATFGAMVQRFQGTVGAFAYLLFILLYTPCASAIAAIHRELGGRWTAFAVVWTTALAYSVAVAFFQIATLAQHPVQSLAWVLGLGLALAGLVTVMRRLASGPDRRTEPAPASPARACCS